MGHRGEKKRHRALKIYGIWALLVVLVNLAAGIIPGLGDWYIRHVFPVWVNTYGRLMDIFPFSVGEWMLAAGVAVLGVALALGLALPVRVATALAARTRKAMIFTICPRWIRRYYIFFAWTLLSVCTVMTLNCSAFHWQPVRKT